MAAFKDSKSREWSVAVTVGVVNRIKDKADLRYALDDKMKMYFEIIGDPCKLADIVYAIIKPQADAAGVTLEDFADALDGDVIVKMAEAFEGALVDFFPPPMRGPLKELAKKREAYRTSTATWAIEKMGTMDAANAAKTDAEARFKALASSTPNASTSGPESLASTPTP
jgi:hypothetical protein